MGIDLKSAPDHFKTKLPDEERKALGKLGWTAEQAFERHLARKEKDLQDEVAAWLDINSIWYSRARMDKRSTLRKGTPDFICCVEGQFLAVECKSSIGRVTPEQDEEIKSIWACKGKAIIAYDLNYVIATVRSMQAQVRVVQEALQKDGWRNKV